MTTILSIGMIVKNEEAVLAKTLDALTPLREAIDCELIIADTGSTDHTVEIAQQYADKLLHIQWENDFAKARNATLSKAKGQWFLYLDADEVLRDPEELISFFQSKQYLKYHSATIAIYNITSTRENVWNVFWSPRFFQRYKNSAFKGVIHEYCPTIKPTYDLKNTNLWHVGYDNDQQDKMKQKALRNTAIMEKALQGKMNDIERAKMLLDYADALNLMHDRQGAMKQVEQALLLIEQYQKQVPQWYIYQLARAYSEAARTLQTQEKWSETLEYCQEYWNKQIQNGVQDLDVIWAEAYSHYQLEDYSACIAEIQHYLELVDLDLVEVSDYFVLASISFKEVALFLLSYSYFKLQQYEQAWRTALEIKEEKIQGRDVLDYLFKIVLADGFPERIASFYKRASQQNQWSRYLPMLHQAMNVLDQAAKEEWLDALRSLGSEAELGLLKLAFTNDAEELIQQLQAKVGEKLAPEWSAYLAKLMAFDVPMNRIINLIDWTRLADYLSNLQIHVDDFAHLAVGYYTKHQNDQMTIEEKHLAQYTLCYCLMNTFTLTSAEIFAWWRLLIRYAYSYMQAIYQPEIFKAESHIFSPLEHFVYYSGQAIEALDQGNDAQAIRYIRLGFKHYAKAKEIVEGLTEEIEKRNRTEAQIELEHLAEQVKKQIEELINEGNTLQAGELVNELADILPEDLDVIRYQQALGKPEMLWH